MPDKELTNIELQALKVIRDYIAHYGAFPTVRFVMEELEYKSPRSASILFEKLYLKKYLKRSNNGSWRLANKVSLDDERVGTINVPLVGEVACGMPIMAEENVQGYFAVSSNMMSRNRKYFLLRAIGDSMNLEGIKDGDLLLVRQQSTANNGDIVIALINDEATAKRIDFRADCIILHPNSTNPNHFPIILNDDFSVQGVVEKVLSNFYSNND
jgi:repressor LexA